jgi:hypothetical protein
VGSDFSKKPERQTLGAVGARLQCATYPQSPFSGPSLVEEFSQGWLTDNGLMALSVQADEAIKAEEIIELAAGARSIYELTTLLCREQTRLTECAKLWQEAREVFETAVRIWEDVPQDGELVTYHRCQLERLYGLALDRCELYNPSATEREL